MTYILKCIIITILIRAIAQTKLRTSAIAQTKTEKPCGYYKPQGFFRFCSTSLKTKKPPLMGGNILTLLNKHMFVERSYNAKTSKTKT